MHWLFPSESLLLFEQNLVVVERIAAEEVSGEIALLHPGAIVEAHLKSLLAMHNRQRIGILPHGNVAGSRRFQDFLLLLKFCRSHVG